MAKRAVKARGKTPAKSAQNVTPYAPAKWERVFLASLRSFGVVSQACIDAKIDRRTAYHRKDKFSEFELQWSEALEEYADSLELEANRRARDGIVKGIYHQGVLMSTELQYSDQLMALMLKAKRPDQYADKLMIKLDPSHVALLAKLGMSPSDAWLMFIQELSNADASASANGG